MGYFSLRGRYYALKIVLIDVSEGLTFIRSLWLAYRDKSLPNISHCLSIRGEGRPDRALCGPEKKQAQCLFSNPCSLSP